jgi:hypothetical protein
MGLINHLKEFCNIHQEYCFVDKNPDSQMENTAGIVVRADDSYMEMLMKLTEYLEQEGFTDEELEMEGVSVEAWGEDILVTFPAIK